MIRALSAFKDEKAVESLIVALNDEDVNVRSSTVDILEMIGGDHAVGILITALNDEDLHVRENIAKALNKITGKEFGKAKEKWQEWWEENKAK